MYCILLARFTHSTFFLLYISLDRKNWSIIHNHLLGSVNAILFLLYTWYTQYTQSSNIVKTAGVRAKGSRYKIVFLLLL